MKWIVLASLLLAGCLTTPEPDHQASTAFAPEVCDEDHLTMYVLSNNWGGNGTPLEENGFNILSIYRFQCGDEVRELWGIELEPKQFQHERLLLKMCGWFSTCKTTADFKFDGEVLLEQYTMVLSEEHIITAKVVKTGDKFPGYTSLWTLGNGAYKTTHSVGREVGAGTFSMTPLPWEHHGIIGSPENLVHMVADVTLTMERVY